MRESERHVATVWDWRDTERQSETIGNCERLVPTLWNCERQ